MIGLGPSNELLGRTSRLVIGVVSLTSDNTTYQHLIRLCDPGITMKGARYVSLLSPTFGSGTDDWRTAHHENAWCVYSNCTIHLPLWMSIE
jgi:hypothetical protein